MLQDGATGGEVTSEQIGWYGGIVFSIFLIGWAMGGIGFSMAAEYFGHTKLLIATIVIYAVFTGLTAGALFGDLGFGPLAERFGRRPVFGLMCLGSLLLLTATYFVPHRYAEGVVLLPVLGFFNNGIFSGFPIYLPELYPTRLRATGAGFCFKAGRILASAAPFVTGWLVTRLGPFNNAASAITLIYLLGLAILPFATETKGRPLPE